MDATKVKSTDWLVLSPHKLPLYLCGITSVLLFGAAAAWTIQYGFDGFWFSAKCAGMGAGFGLAYYLALMIERH